MPKIMPVTITAPGPRRGRIFVWTKSATMVSPADQASVSALDNP